MAPTHVVMSLALAAFVSLVAPESAPSVATAALVGGVFPDLDMLVGVHRKTFHQLELFAAGTVVFGLVAAVSTSSLPLLVAIAGAAALAHCLADLLGGSSEPRPWEAATDRGVYVRAAGGWVAPRRWIAYDGSPGDVALAVVCAVPAVVVFGQLVTVLVATTLVVGVAYALFRKRIPQLSGRTPALTRALVTMVSMLVRRR